MYRTRFEGSLGRRHKAILLTRGWVGEEQQVGRAMGEDVQGFGGRALGVCEVCPEHALRDLFRSAVACA